MINAIVILCAYLIGSIPSALWIGQTFYNTDVRQHGSGNLGATNTFRVLGKKAGSIVMIMDILKGTASVLLLLLPVFSDATVHALLLGIIAVFGHMFPVFAGFRGGKAVATSAGVILGYAWPLFLLLLVVFLVSLKLKKMVSLSSITVAIVGLLYSVIYLIVTHDYALPILVLVLAIFIIYRHRENMKRIKNGTEPKVTWI